MKYSDGNEAKIGDSVAIDEHCRGVVIALIDTKEYGSEYSKEQWGYLKEGILIDTDFGGIIHYLNATDEKIILLKRAE